MLPPINIHNSGVIVELPVGIYKVNVLGGWGVTVGDFSFKLTSLSNGKIIRPKGTIWRVQYYSNCSRSKKIFSLDIPKRDRYKIDFINQKSLKVKRSNLFIFQLIEKPIPNKNIEIVIE
ncbi:hypothetical protein [Winogradskyella luteola]|uniref:Uncharacterized protein n=1 Tax=Winogradskyella luteola TaxID=2828330 RepID=A0A9X1FCB0_9FLAO|nr:hypothetical protein [Winogradskyella luteola]MBV7270333.1 hypothetical protein [Winogradskyella luteola]